MPLALAVLGGGSVLFAALALFQKNLYASAMCLLGVLLQIALLFFSFGAQTLGWMQVLVYAGAVVVLLVVGILSSGPRAAPLWADWGIRRPLVWAVALLPLAELGLGLAWTRFAPFLPPVSGAELESQMAKVLFGPYALLTEAVGFLILLAALAMVREGE